MEKGFEDFNQFGNEIKDAYKKMVPELNGLMTKLRTSTANLEPKGIKDCKVKGRKAKVTIYKDNAIKIEFADKDYGTQFYDSLK